MTQAGECYHVFRPGPFHRRRSYWLDGDALRWRIGSRAGHLPLAEVKLLRLHLQGDGGVSQCVLVDRADRAHRLCDRYWPSWGRRERRDASFRGLTFALTRRLKRLSPDVALTAGPSRGEWIAVCFLAALVTGIFLVGAGVMLARWRFEPAAAVFMALTVISQPMLWAVLRSGGPKPLDPDSLPEAGPSGRRDCRDSPASR